MTIVQVSYTVPVEVVVDTDTGEVKSVVVIEESIEIDHRDGTVHTDGYAELTDPLVRARAVEIAENSEWPAWEHGW